VAKEHLSSLQLKGISAMDRETIDVGFRLKREIDIGQILTVISIVGSLIGFFYAWSNDRSLKDKEYADRVRKSAAIVTAKVERWGELSDRYFEDLQPVIVDVSEQVTKNHERQPANRMLFKGMMDAKAKASQRIVDEQLQLAYMELYGYVPSFQQIFDKTIADIRSAEYASQMALRNSLQDLLLDQEILDLPDSPQVGRKFRDKIEEERLKLRSQILHISKPLRRKMLAVIKLKDIQLRDAQDKPELAALFQEGLADGKLRASP
jgi:hypothetical protein